ncbi:MAG: glutamyl-tRNA reductase [Lachnospiraceae bacterium]|nr:glutamyl-tRNA reductase [Lachnospiraceae bacterium]
MSIQMAGIDHSRAGIDVRSIFSFTKKNMEAAFEDWKTREEIEGCVLLSTCNRMELWVSTKNGCSLSLVDELCEKKGALPETYRPYFAEREGREAVEHLFRLAGGLESRILGEDQIITQVKEALAFAREQYMADKVLEVLFRLAVTAGKKVKTEVTLSTASQSVIHQAIEVLHREGYEVSGKKCMVIGNGAMGRLTASTLQNQGADVTVTVRQYRSGLVDIPENCKRINYGDRMELFRQCDLVVSATSSPNYTIKTQQVQEIQVDHPVLIIDLAVPRDVEATVAKLPNMTVYDIDYFQVDIQNARVKENIARAEEILQKQQEEFYDWYECRNVVPRIQRIKESAARDLELRLTKVLRNLPLEMGDSDNLGEQIDTAAVKMMNKLLFGLRDEVSGDAFRECLQAMERIFGTEEIHCEKVRIGSYE